MNNSYLQIASRRRSGGNFPSTGLVSYWNMDTDGSVPDSVGSNDGIINNVIYSASGKLGGAYSFDIAGSNITVGTSADLTPPKLTVAMWVKRTATWSGTYQSFFWAKPDAYNSPLGWQFDCADGANENTPLVFRVSGNNYIAKANNVDPDTFFPLNEWVYIAATFDSDTNVGALYKNGVSVADGGYGTADIINSNTVTKYIGYPHSPYGNNGLMDEIGIWSRALTPDEITALYNSGDGLTY